jgi:hypothetical protein
MAGKFVHKAVSDLFYFICLISIIVLAASVVHTLWFFIFIFVEILDHHPLVTSTAPFSKTWDTPAFCFVFLLT